MKVLGKCFVYAVIPAVAGCAVHVAWTVAIDLRGRGVLWDFPSFYKTVMALVEWMGRDRFFGTYRFIMTVTNCIDRIFPGLVVTLLACGWLTKRFRNVDSDGQLHCRKCGYILRGISEPRCSECGERI